MRIHATVVADSINSQGDRLVSVVATYPRIIHSEVMTHRMLSKNSASSRAIPFKKMVEAVKENPFIPIAFQEEHKGMQGTVYLGPRATEIATSAWLVARNKAIEQAEYLNSKGVTKQLCNRLLEPFMWHTVLITGNVNEEGWLNFFNLRCPQYQMKDGHPLFKSKKDFMKKYGYPEFSDIGWLQHNKGQAEIHMMALAEAVYDAIQESEPRKLEAEDWHIPFINLLDDIGNFVYLGPNASYNHVRMLQVKIATAMAARTSYTIFGDNKKEDYNKMLELHDRLISANPLHASPMEHCARVMTDEEYVRNIKGELEDDHFEVPIPKEEANGWCRNFKGFIQYRHILENETNRS